MLSIVLSPLILLNHLASYGFNCIWKKFRKWNVSILLHFFSSWWDAEWKCKLHTFMGGIVGIIIFFSHNWWNMVPLFNQLNWWLLFWNCDRREEANWLKQKTQMPQCLRILSPLSPCHVFAQHNSCLSEPTHYPSGCSLSSWRFFFFHTMFKIIRSLGFRFWVSSWHDYWNRD